MFKLKKKLMIIIDLIKFQVDLYMLQLNYLILQKTFLIMLQLNYLTFYILSSLILYFFNPLLIL